MTPAILGLSHPAPDTIAIEMYVMKPEFALALGLGSGIDALRSCVDP